MPGTYAARITLEWVVVVTCAELLLGLGLAMIVSSGIRWRGLVISLLMIPIVLPPVSVSLPADPVSVALPVLVSINI